MLFQMFAWVLLPLGALLLGLLALPLPAIVRQVTLRQVDNVLFYKVHAVVRDTTLFAVVFGLCILTFAYECIALSRANGEYAVHKEAATINERVVIAKFRTERNWWLTLFTLCLWGMVYRVRALMHHIHELEGRVPAAARLNQKDASTATKPSPVAGVNAVPSAPPAEEDAAPPASNGLRKRRGDDVSAGAKKQA